MGANRREFLLGLGALGAYASFEEKQKLS